MKIEKGINNKVGTRVVLTAPEGVGKTTLAAQAPTPVFIDCEDGTLKMDVERLRPSNMDEVREAIKLASDGSYKTIVIDTVDALAEMMANDMCATDNKHSIEDYGFGKGWSMLAERFFKFLNYLDTIKDRGINVVLVCHTEIKKFERPDLMGSFDRYQLKLPKKLMPLAKEWCDAMLFCNFDQKIIEVDGRSKGIGGKDRIIHTEHSAAWDAKNRFGLPESIPMKYENIAHIFNSEGSPAPAIVVEKDVYKTLDNLWNELGKTNKDRPNAFAYAGANGLDFEWTELTEEQAQKIIDKMREVT